MAVSHTIELANARDAVSIARLSRDLIEAGLGWAWTPGRVLRAIRREDTNVVVARHADSVAGFGIMRYAVQEAHLLLLAVRSDDQRQGLGATLVGWLEESALSAGVGVVYLEVRASNRVAQGFYERLGYRRLVRLPGYYEGREAAYRMARDLWVPVDGAG
jgi:ribosomal-protein-alanine N-acetyltransferase